MQNFYKPKEFDREEWEERHTNNIEWHKMWNRLFFIFIIFFIVAAIMVNMIAMLIVIGAQMLFTIFDIVCRIRHDKLHDELEQNNG